MDLSKSWQQYKPLWLMAIVVVAILTVFAAMLAYEEIKYNQCIDRGGTYYLCTHGPLNK